MLRLTVIFCAIILTLCSLCTAIAEDSNVVTWQGEAGPLQGKTIVYIAGDHEYRGEESLPALARIMAKHYGATCHFMVTTDPATGDIKPGSNHITGLEKLEAADLLVIFVRFQAFPDEQMKHIADYLKRGGPVIGMRTSTHGFKGLKGEYAYLNEGYKGDDFKLGFGRQVLGEHWAGHYGKNHAQSSRLIIEEANAMHPVLRGVSDMHVQCGGYFANPMPNSTVIARGVVLNGMNADAEPDPKKEQVPVVWTRTYVEENPKSRVFTTTHGASEDILNAGFRRLLVNAHLWCLGLEEQIKADAPIDFVGPYHPATFNFGGYRLQMKPSDLAGWETPIMDPKKPIGKRGK